MMFDKEKYEKRFSEHIAKLSDYGTIKVLDFSKPGHLHRCDSLHFR